jgi:hypothetical protein
MLESFDNNADGLGWMHSGHAVEKMHAPRARDVKDLTRALNGRLRDTEVAVHFRWRTHGDIDTRNTHPYALARGGWLMHNGMLAAGSWFDPALSDTWHYVNFELEHADAAPTDPVWRETAKRIGPGNKFLVMGPTGSMHVVNRGSGIAYQGLWLSNTYSTPSLFKRPARVWAPATFSPATLAGPAPATAGPAPATAGSVGLLQRRALDALHRRAYGAPGARALVRYPALGED